ncbi:MAG: type II toxin-antitoxin system death-on-curing family toxin [Clostridia bacterium]|nr:type II toxin-antitoxin system death-on-curing family toxin [Clostridia bacterium]
MILPTPEELILLHTLVSEQNETENSLRDRGLLESAAFSPNAAFGATELYPTAIEKASRLFFALTKNHPFADGNKRIGLLAALVTLHLNQISVKATDDELVTLTLALAEGTLAYPDILAFFLAHTEPQS